MVKLRIEPIFRHLFYPTGKPEDYRSCVTKGLQWIYYGCTLCALALEPSDFCNVGVNPRNYQRGHGPFCWSTMRT
jgi:hypothetical protein